MLNNIVALLDSGVAASTNSYESIATVTVGAGGSSSITFSSIPSTYKHLQIRLIARDTTGSPWGNLYATGRFNSDSGNNYAYHRLYGTGTAAGATATSTTNKFVFLETASTETSNTFSPNVIDILDYSNINKYKTIRIQAGGDFNDANSEVDLASGLWQNTSAISQIDLIAASGNFAQYSHFALYGIKG